MKWNWKKTDNTLDELLETCLSDIKAGRATREECLSHYKEQADMLEPLLRVSDSLYQVPQPRPSDARMLASRQRLLQEFHASSERRASWPLALRRALTVPSLAFSAVFAFVVMTVFGAGIYFATTNERPTASAYPNPDPTEMQTVPPVTQPTIAFNGIGLPSEVDGPYEIAGAPDGTLWFAQTDATRVGSVDADGNIQDWPIASREGRAAGITVDSSGKVWFTVSSSQSIFELDPETNEISSWRAEDGTLGRIAAGKDGRIWFIARSGSRIYSLNPKTDKFTAFDVEGAEYLEAADDGLWFSGKPGQLGKITAGGQVQVFEAPGEPAAMVWDGESLWYAGGTLIGRFDSASRLIQTYPLENKLADRIATDGQQNIWFGSQGGTELGILQAKSGQISTRSLDSVVQNLYWLAVGTDKVWMSDGDSQFIYAFSVSKSGELNLSNPVSFQTERLMAALAFPSLY